MMKPAIVHPSTDALMTAALMNNVTVTK